MTDRYVGVRRESSHNGNYIPVGRQLPRTPPLDEVKKHLVFCDDNDPSEACGSPETGDGDQDDNHLREMFDYITAETKPEPNDDSMLKGMKGYQLTRGDLEFIQKMREEKLVKELRGSLEELQRALRKGMMAAELVYASRENAQVELQKFPSCGELTEWVKVVLGTKLPSAHFSDLDTKSLLAMVTEEDVQKVAERKRSELARMRKTVEDKRKKEAKARELLEKQIAKEQMKIQGLMSQLSDLKSQLAQEEEALEMRISKVETPKIKTELKNVVSSGGIQVKCGAKERKMAVTFPERLQDTTNQSKSTRNKLADGQTSVKDRADKSTREGLRARRKSRAVAERPTASGTTARGSQRKVEGRGSNPESERAVRGQRKPPGAAQTVASQPKSGGKGRAGEAAAAATAGRQKAAMAAEDAGLRRSKRIASRS